MEDEPIVLKEASCPSLSAQSTITYQIGIAPDGTVHIRAVQNTGTGIFSSVWVPLHSVLDLLQDHDDPFTWEALLPLFPNRSVNTACFLLAALKKEGLVRQSVEQPRRYEMVDPKPFMAEIQALMAPKEKHKKGGSKPPPIEVIPPAEPVMSADSTEATA